jgi:phosphoglycolate phosphatase-like HAD superfamily hydrolase
MEGIKNIIFDLGGVILNIDYMLSHKAFSDLGFPDFDDMYSKLKQNHLFDDLETGRITADNFIATIQQQSKIPLHESDIVKAWNAMLLDFPLRFE